MDRYINVLVAPTIYVTNERHFEWVERTVRYLRESDIYFDLIGYVNKLAPEYKERVESLFDKVYYNKKNILADSWNRAISYGIRKGYDYIIIPNLDIAVQPETLGKMVDFAEDKGGIMWSGYCTNNPYKPAEDFVVNSQSWNNYDAYALFMVNKELFKTVGKFDNHFKLYCEDVDMEHRIFLAGATHWCIYDAPFYHEGSVCLKNANEPGLDSINNGAWNYFIKKWGAEPRHQTWKHPFNDQNLNYTYIENHE